MTLLIVLVWALAFAEPSLPELLSAGVPVFTMSVLVLLLSFLVYLYARHEKQIGEVL